MTTGHTGEAGTTGARKVAVSLPAGLLERVERLRLRTGESRSGVVQRALSLLLDRLDHFEAVREYVEAYGLHPETDDEMGATPTPEELMDVAGDEWE